MSSPWLYAPDLHAGRNVLLPDEARHVRQVLRCRPGDAVVLFDGRGGWGPGVIAAAAIGAGPPASRKRLHAEAAVDVAQVQQAPPAAYSLTLIAAACKGPRLDYLVEKTTELGVDRLLLAEFERSVVHLGPAAADRLLITAIAACKQAQRPRLPVILAGLDLEAAIAQAAEARLAVAERAAPSTPLASWLASAAAANPRMAAIIGPEGGLTEPELAWLAGRGGERVWLGRHILRVETAALAVAACWSAQAASRE